MSGIIGGYTVPVKTEPKTCPPVIIITDSDPGEKTIINKNGIDSILSK